MDPRLTVVQHPLVHIGLTRLRMVSTPPAEFRRHLREVAALIFAEATRTLPTREVEITTPLARTTGADFLRPVVLAPILRAALGMVDGIWPALTTAQVAHIGIFRDEATTKPVPYYAKYPADLDKADVFLLDPMLATGQSAAVAADQLKANGAKSIRFLSIISCPQGLEYFHSQHPDIPVYTGAVDLGLNERSYIVPGLGDAGDRYFGT
jgi:uracil phosphoribosyltransferase